jgi:prepilin-type N-terminal cleavage/methylation domain-containing protein
MTEKRASAPTGFTLIEIMCVMVIIAIAAAIVFAGLGNQSDLQAESSARAIMADLLYAQNRAIATQQNVYVSFTGQGTSSGSYSLCSSLSPVTYLTNPISQTTYTNNWTGTSWSASLPSGWGTYTAMYFNSLGQPVYSDSSPIVSPLTIAITSGTATETITIQALTGEMSVQ